MKAKLTQLEYNTLLEIYRQSYEHVRHLQKMRATYFNFYILVIGFSVAALVSVFSSPSSDPWRAVIFIGGLIWIISIFTMIRSERWGGHITHDLRKIRIIQNTFASQFESVAEVVPNETEWLENFKFDRSLWDRNRSTETPVSILGAIICAIFIGFALSKICWLQIACGLLLVIIPLILWRSEVSNLKKRHAKCCLRTSCD
jgi:MFS family permease